MNGHAHYGCRSSVLVLISTRTLAFARLHSHSTNPEWHGVVCLIQNHHLFSSRSPTICPCRIVHFSLHMRAHSRAHYSHTHELADYFTHTHPSHVHIHSHKQALRQTYTCTHTSHSCVCITVYAHVRESILRGVHIHVWSACVSVSSICNTYVYLKWMPSAHAR